MPHSSALLTPTRAPHARLLKHWEGRIVSLLALVRHPHAHHMLTCSLAGLHASSSFSSLAFFLVLFSLLLLSPLTSLALFLSLLSPQNGPSIRFISAGHLTGAVCPKLTPSHLRTFTMTTHALFKKAVIGARERTFLRKNNGVRQSSQKKCV